MTYFPDLSPYEYNPDPSVGRRARGNRTAVTPPTGPALTLAYDQANRLTSYGTTACPVSTFLDTCTGI